jgi:hypothetical protein
MIKDNPVILVYRRTHKGDPGPEGLFGINNCMKKVRNWKFDAVIGVGGLNPWHTDKHIAKKINWIGISPVTLDYTEGNRRLAFEHFLIQEDSGNDVINVAPLLYKYMFEEGNIPRAAKNFAHRPDIYKELINILYSAANSPSSPILNLKSVHQSQSIGKQCGNTTTKPCK